MLDKYFNYKTQYRFQNRGNRWCDYIFNNGLHNVLNPFIYLVNLLTRKGFLILEPFIQQQSCNSISLFYYGILWKNLANWSRSRDGINALAFGVCAGMGYTPQEALGAVLLRCIILIISPQ